MGTIYAIEELDYNITLKFGPDRRLTIEDPLAGSPGGKYYFYASTGTELKVWFVFDETGESLEFDVFQVNPGRLSIRSEKTGYIYKWIQ
ncbi:MAG: hypothetical protein NT027_14640 [Proteobacteria bacterium]|nr:hypothetical protein [Pseudomonadota bacterium]